MEIYGFNTLNILSFEKNFNRTGQDSNVPEGHWKNYYEELGQYDGFSVQVLCQLNILKECILYIFQIQDMRDRTDKELGVKIEGGKFICFSGNCRKEFDSGILLLGHQLHYSHLGIFCCVCNRSYSRKDKLRRHVLSIHTQQQFTCSLCPEKRTCNRKDALMAHQMKVHGVVACLDCGNAFRSTQLLAEHTSQFHPNR